MRKFIVIFMALLLPFSVLEMRADDEDAVIKIPLNYNKGTDFRRDFSPELLTSYYFGMMSCVQTSVSADLGEVAVMVLNCSTGESWYDTFDSGVEPQTLLQISGDAGLYEITYTTEAGDVYEGSFMIE